MFRSLIGVCAGVALLCSAGIASAAAGLQVELAAVSDKAGAGSGRIGFALHNPGKVDVLVLAWETPLAGVGDDLFEVTLDGKPVPYVGRHYKRGLPAASDYIELKAGQTLRTELDLSAYYDMSRTGSYAVQFVGHFHDTFSVRPAQPGTPEKLLPVEDADLRSSVALLWVDGTSRPASLEPIGILNLQKAGSIGFVGCSNTQASGASAGYNAAQTMAADANSYLASGLKGTRYTTWFGKYSSTIYNTLKSNFGKIGDAVTNKPVEFYCDCNDNAYAYVYPTRPYEVHLCNAYWSAPTSGTDSKGGTVIHEISHFDVVANTDDIAYGQTACKRLSKKSSRAIKNADSHEYFAENTPKLN